MRFLTVNLPDQPEVELVLMAPGAPAHDEATTEQEPTERFYGTDCALRDPFGNPVRFTQPPEGPIVVPSAEELRAAQA